MVIGALLCLVLILFIVVGVFMLRRLRKIEMGVLGNIVISQQILQKVQTPPPSTVECPARIEIPIGPVTEQR
jgi:hypothetical protein